SFEASTFYGDRGKLVANDPTCCTSMKRGVGVCRLGAPSATEVSPAICQFYFPETDMCSCTYAIICAVSDYAQSRWRHWLGSPGSAGHLPTAALDSSAYSAAVLGWLGWVCTRPAQ